MIQIVTHNGKPPSKGGLRLGYLVFNPNGTVVVVPATLRVIFPPPPKSLDKPKPAVATTATAHNDFGDVNCPKCGLVNKGAAGYLSLRVVYCSFCIYRFTAKPYGFA